MTTNKRTTETEKSLLIYAVKYQYPKHDSSIQMLDLGAKRSGNYSINGHNKNRIYKLVAGKRYNNYFHGLSKQDAIEFITDYKIYLSLISQLNIKLPKLYDISIIPCPFSNTFLILETQEFIPLPNSLDYITSKEVSGENIIKCFKECLNITLKVCASPFSSLGFDARSTNYLKDGCYIDLMPPKLMMGSEYRKLLTQNNQLSKVKIKWFYDRKITLLYFLLNFCLARKDMTNLFVDNFISSIGDQFGKYSLSKDEIELNLRIVSLYYKKLDRLSEASYQKEYIEQFNKLIDS